MIPMNWVSPNRLLFIFFTSFQVKCNSNYQSYINASLQLIVRTLIFIRKQVDFIEHSIHVIWNNVKNSTRCVIKLKLLFTKNTWTYWEIRNTVTNCSAKYILINFHKWIPKSKQKIKLQTKSIREKKAHFLCTKSPNLIEVYTKKKQTNE